MGLGRCDELDVPGEAAHSLREPGVDAAITRALIGGDPVSAPRPERMPFGPKREALRSLTMSGLLALLDAYEASADAFAHQSNAPRVSVNDLASSRLMGVALESMTFAQVEIVREIESRRPTYAPDASDRLKLLVRWYSESGEWTVAQRLVSEALAV